MSVSRTRYLMIITLNTPVKTHFLLEFSLFHGLNVIYSLESSKSSLRSLYSADSPLRTCSDVPMP
ncbi:hypothetical protein E1B42_13085 [Salmonella enterica subsp. enterica serovar Agona]|uniref:Uncharacterized protein n=11 Tax=Salmonella TaxID=590 RepID=A0A701FLL8_SALEN|nr:hypothetical protein SEEG9184_21615 [Salmonella enterica subsp. enterica serovar Gallinarum str. 9184]APY48409.1 hypothetical protein LFZ6_23220 [Salmonella enterica subsp. enterica serovar Borreze str. SA20041063]ASG56173.1 hypothetical protein LFZ56_19030 [Salmonella bongori serovar 66:z41:- str. SA19983605]ASG89839.1 hypothetical protein LFZ47_21070 [Salmonella enterica subsp. salamae serovar 55:k:z39 str. 1315K]AXC87647.1 hypothetical protein DOE57_21305 [Salmonella enterica subsp. salam